MSFDSGLRTGKRIAIALIGAFLLVLGLALLVLPGPSLPVILGGLAVLSVEYPWARKWHDHVRDRLRRMVGVRQTKRRAGPPMPAGAPARAAGAVQQAPPAGVPKRATCRDACQRE